MRRGIARYAFALCAVLLLVPALPAQERDHDITIDDYFTQADIFQIAISPDGKHVAYAEGRWQESTDDRKADLWVVEVASKQARRLTHDRMATRALQWSPDGEYIYFLANRKREGEKDPAFSGKAQVWRIKIKGGQLMPVTRLDGGVEAFQLAGDGSKLFYLVHEEVIDGDFKALRRKYKKLEYGHGVEKFGRIWALDLGNWRASKVWEAERNVREFKVDPKGEKIALITTPDDKVVSFEGQSRVEVYDLTTKKTTLVPDKVYRKDAQSPYAWLENLAWSVSCGDLAFCAVWDGYPAEVIVAQLSGDKWPVFKVQRPTGVCVKGYGTPLQWRQEKDGAALLFMGEKQARVHLCKAQFRSAEEQIVTMFDQGDHVVEGFSTTDNGDRTALVVATPRDFANIHTLDGTGGGKKMQRVTDLNPQTKNWKLPRLSTVSWKGAGGRTVEGILELPPDHRPGQKVPLVVEIHGGPTTATYFKLQYWIYGRTLLPAKGYAVLCPNYRGSTGYGDKFVTDLLGRENDLDVTDILKGVDHLVEQGIADPERLAVAGWSNGGYLTNCIITKTTRFKAAISGASITDAVLEWGANDEPAYAAVFKQGLPWNASERYHKASPTYQLDKVRTPTLIHVGANDERCPPANSRMLYRALKEYNKVPTELIVYPGEGHGLSKMSNRRAKMEWDLAWLERYVKGSKK